MNTLQSYREQKKAQAELYKKKFEQLESGEVDKMMEEYEFWKERLPILKAEIEEILGMTLDEPKSSKEKENGKTNRPKKSVQDVLQEMVDLLEKHPEGMKKADIAKKLNVGNPKVDEAFALEQSRFEPRMRGPKAVIKLKG